MRKTASVRATSCIIFRFCISLVLSASAGALAQNESPDAPNDPNALMLSAAKTNGLAGADMQPWHAKIIYKLFDEQGNFKSQGTIEEFWVSPTKYKVTYASGSLSHAEFGTDKGLYTIGGAGMDIVPAFKVQRELLEPLPPPHEVMQNNYSFQERELGQIRATCLQRHDTDGNTSGPTWCLEPNAPNLRVIANTNSDDVLYSNPVKFQGQTFAGDLKFSAGELKNIENDPPAFSAHLETIEPLTGIDDTTFAPPPDAAHSPFSGLIAAATSAPPNLNNSASRPTKVNISAGVAVGMLQYNPSPIYPPAARAAGISGTVVMMATIGIDGRPSNLSIVQGPAELQQAALDAVRTWRYRPYLLNGEPVEVRTTINIVFTLGGR
jgi:TonB family protein